MGDFVLKTDHAWEHLHLDPRRIDANVRLVASLLDAGDFAQLFRRTGLRAGPDGVGPGALLPVFIETTTGGKKDIVDRIVTQGKETGWFQLHVLLGVAEEFERNEKLDILVARISWNEGLAKKGEAAEGGAPRSAAFRTAIAKLAAVKGVERISIPNPVQPCLHDSLKDIDLPRPRVFNNQGLDGNGVVIGVIDDGCALAHRHFLAAGSNKTRIKYLWDQGRAAAGNGGWAPPQAPLAGQQGTQNVQNPVVFDGFELDETAIDAALAACLTSDGRVDEDKVYRHLQYAVPLASHGTHVLDIAAGNGASLAGNEGVACKADIVFVQLPTNLVESGGPLLEDSLLLGVHYVFDRAARLGLPGKPLPAVANISYGGYSGPHDGSSPLASGIDGLLRGATNRAVVVSAGNGFEADCHARLKIAAKKPAKQPWHWRLAPHDSSANLMEIYSPAQAPLAVQVTPPGANQPLPAVEPGHRMTVVDAGGDIIGWIDNFATGNGEHLVRLELNATAAEDPQAIGAGGSFQQGMPPPLTAPAPSGTWIIALHNRGSVEAEVHGWIARDDMPRRGTRRRQQSRFAPGQAEQTGTVADLATGELAICVGAHNAATGEVCRYSAAGPTRDGRPKPDITAPAEVRATGRGVLCASSRRAQRSSFNGTSAAAPHVAGLVALLMQYNRDCGGAPLGAARIRDAVTKGASPKGLIPNRHQEVEARRPASVAKQTPLKVVVGSGRISVRRSLGRLP